MLLDPIRRLGWKYVPTPKSIISPEIENRIRMKFKKDIEFFQNIEEFIPLSTIIK
jgi:hypothetical protein